MGKNVRCPGCQQVFQVGGAAKAPAQQQVQATPPAPRPAPQAARQPEPMEDDIGYSSGPSSEAKKIAAGGGFWLSMSAWYLVVTFVVQFLIGGFITYMGTKAVFEEMQRQFNPGGGPNPFAAAGGVTMGAMLIGMVCGAVLLAPFIVFMFLGGSFLPKFKSRGIIITGVVMAFILAGLGVIGVIFKIMSVFASNPIIMGRALEIPMYVRLWDIVTLIVNVGGIAMLILGGVKALGALNHPSVKAAYGIR